MTISLRPYQQDLKEKIYQSWQQGNRNVLAVLPTGGGKTRCFSNIAFDGVQQGLKQAIIVHRNELVSQIAVTLAQGGIPHKIIGSDKAIGLSVRRQRAKVGQSFYNPSAPTTVVGVDTLIARQSSMGSWAHQVDRWIQDEAHHLLRDNKWGKAVNMMPNAYGLGVTATPVRADGQGLGREFDGVFDDMVLGPSMRWLIDNEFLSDYEVVCPTSDMQVRDEDKSKSGDWSNQYLKKSAKKSKIVGDVVENYIKFAFGRKAICFATDVETAGEIANKFNEFGIRAAALSAKTPDNVREKYLDEFESGYLTVLVNVDLFDEGFDVPSCEVCIMARPTGSLGKFRQMIGRVLRPQPGKIALIIDHVSNIVRHKLPDFPIQWTLARRDKRAKSAPDPEDVPLTICVNPTCVKPFPRFKPACPFCGESKPLPSPRDRTIEMVEGDLVLLDKTTLDRLRGLTTLESAADIAARVAHVTGNPAAAKGVANRQIQKIAEHNKLKETLAQWAGIQRAAGFDDREIQKKFYLTVGYDVLSALDASKSRSDMQKLRELIEGWYAPR